MSIDVFDQVRTALAFVPSRDRETWLRVAMAIKSEIGEGGFEIWDEWSQRDESYRETDAKTVWKSLRRDGGVTIATLFHEAKAHGWQGKSGGNGHATRRPSLAHARDQLEAEDAERSQRQRQAAVRALELWNAAEAAAPDHHYLSNKSIEPYRLKIYSGPMRINGVSCDGALIVPARDATGVLHSLQFITPDGSKLYLPDSRKSGCFFAIGGQKNKILIAEGVATGD